MGTTLAQGYVQIIPSAQGISGSISKILNGEAANAGKSAGTNLSSGITSGLGTAAKVGAAAITAIGTAIGGLGVKFTQSVGGVASYGDSIDKMSQKMNLSSAAYQEWDAVLQHSGSSIDTMKASMKTLATAAEKGNDAFGRLGITQQDLANMSQQDLFEATIAGLQNVTDDTERTYLAGQLLGRGATELGALLNTSAEDTQAMRDRVHELGGVMSEDAVKASAAYQDSLQDMQTAIQGVSRNALSDFLPSMTTVMDGITSIFAGESGGAGKITEGINGIIEQIGVSAPKFAQTGRQIMTAIAQAITQNLPQIVQKGTEIILNLATGLMQNTPSILSTAASVISTIASGIATAMPTLLSAGLEMLTTITQGLTDGMPILAARIPELVGNIVGFFIQALPQIAVAGVEMISSLIQGFSESVPEFIENIPKFYESVAAAFQGVDWKDLGQRLITAIAEGAKALAAALPAALETIGTAAMTAFKAIDWKGVGRTAIEFIKTAISGTGNLIATALKTVGTTAMNAFKTIDWKGVGKAAIEFIKTAASTAGSLVVAALKTIGTNAMNAFKNTDWKGVGKSAIGFIKTAISGAGNLVVTALKTVGTTAVNKFKEIDWKDLGKNIIDGIINGVKNAASSLYTAMKNLAKDALKAAKDKLKIGSPSKVFADEVGRWIPEGIAEGIEKNLNPVETAMDKATDLTMDTAKVNVGVNANGTSGINGGSHTVTNLGGVTIYINAQDYSNANEVAEAVSNLINRKVRQYREAWA